VVNDGSQYKSYGDFESDKTQYHAERKYGGCGLREEFSLTCVHDKEVEWLDYLWDGCGYIL